MQRMTRVLGMSLGSDSRIKETIGGTVREAFGGIPEERKA